MKLKDKLNELKEIEKKIYILLTNGEWYGGIIEEVEEDYIIYKAELNPLCKRYQKTVIKIDSILAYDFQCDPRGESIGVKNLEFYEDENEDDDNNNSDILL